MSDRAKLNGSSIHAYQSEIESIQVFLALAFIILLDKVCNLLNLLKSKLREVEQKINLENVQFEELMLELQLKKGSKNTMPTTSATMANFSTLATTTAAPPPLTTMASLEGGYMTDSSIGNNIHGGGGPTITISHPNGKRGIVLES